MLSALRTLFPLPIRSQCCFGCRRVLVLKLRENFLEVPQLGLTISAFFSISLTCEKTPQNRECQNHDRDTDSYCGDGWNLIRAEENNGFFLFFFAASGSREKKLKKKKAKSIRLALDKGDKPFFLLLFIGFTTLALLNLSTCTIFTMFAFSMRT